MPKAASMMYVFVVFNNYLFYFKDKQVMQYTQTVKHKTYRNNLTCAIHKHIYNKPCSNEAFVSKIRFRIMVIM